MANYKAKYRIKNSNGEYDVVHLETTADQVIESEQRLFVNQEEKQAIKNYTHYQTSAQETWEIEHNLNRFPQVTIVDSANTVVVGDIQYINANIVRTSFKGAFSGIAYLN